MSVLPNLLTFDRLLRSCPTTPACTFPLGTGSSFAVPKC